MADQRITLIARICDATTLTQGLAVDSSGRITVAAIATSITPGTGAGHLGKAEDAAHGSGDTGVMALAVRTDTPMNRSNADGDYEPLQVSGGRLWCRTTVDDALPAGTNNIGDVDVVSLVPGTGAANLGKAEDAAHTSGDTGVMALGVRNDIPTVLAGTDLDYTPLAVDQHGHLQVDVLSGGGQDQPVHPSVDTTNVDTPVTLAAGASGNADSADLPNKRLQQVIISSSVAFKAVLGTLDNTTFTPKVVFFGGPGQGGPVIYHVPHPEWFKAPSAGTGTQGWRTAITNLDTSETAHFYVAYLYQD